VSKNTIDKSKLMQLIFYLDDKDYKELGLWVRSPIHNSNQMVIDLYDVIKHKYRNTNKPIEILRIMKSLNLLPRTASEEDISPRDKQELRRTMHLLSDQIEDFLIWKATQKKTIIRKRYLMDELMIRRAYPLIPAVLRKTRKIHEASTLRDVPHCNHEYLLTEMDFYMTSIPKNLAVASDMKLTMDALCRYAFSTLLRYYCYVLNAQEHIKMKHNYPIMEVLESYITDSKYLEHYTIRVYYKLLKLIKEKRVEDYYEFKNMITKDTFNNTELRYLFGLLYNFCIIKIRQGDNRFIKEEFYLYKESLKRGILTAGIRFSERKFVFIIKSALSMNQPEWADNFIEKYSNELRPDVRENTVNYGKALYAFYIGEYSRAKDFLHMIDKVTDFSTRLRIKMLLIKIYYDNNELTSHNIDTHPINSELESLKQLIRPGTSSKLSEFSRSDFAGFANFFKRILSRKKRLIKKESLDSDNIEALKTELAGTESIMQRYWLNDKLDELIEEVKS